jgi:NAD-dependent DNA ligase
MDNEKVAVIMQEKLENLLNMLSPAFLHAGINVLRGRSRGPAHGVEQFNFFEDESVGKTASEKKITIDATRMDSQAEQLAESIRHHNEKYWVEHKPEISDTEYDKLVERLRALDPENPVLQELVEDTTSFAKVEHAAPMLSIEKVFTVEDVVAWAEDCGAFKNAAPDGGIVASYKIDGSSCSLIYENGALLRAASRGNGMLGDDITRNVKTISDVPQTIDIFKGSRVEVRGEVYMPIASFRAALALFEKNLAEGVAREEDRPTNPRNYCAGSLKQKDAEITRARGLSFMAHAVAGKLPGCDNKTDAEQQEHLQQAGFQSSFYKLLASPQDVAGAVAKIESERKTLPYEIDGVVFTVNTLALHPELGSTSHHPRYKLAYKFGRDRGETTVKRVLWHTTRSGRVCPAMEVAPISLGGATVTLCTLHNAKTVRETGLAVGDKILLEREVIPYFVQKISPEVPNSAVLPATCNSCGAELAWDETETHLVCANLGGCPSQLHDYLSYYVSRGVTNMMGLGEKLIAKLIAVKLLKSPVDFYTLTEKGILDNVERQGETSAKNIVNAIQSRREQTLETFLVSLGIRGLGPSVAARLAAHFGTLSRLREAPEEEYLKIDGIAETLAAGIKKGLADRAELIAGLLNHVRLKEAAKVEGHLSGKSFCLTGHIEFDYKGKHYDARPDIEALLKSKGASIKSVNKTLTYLVVGSDPGSKVEKAQKAGVAILDTAGLLGLLAAT